MIDIVLNQLINGTGSHAYCLVGQNEICLEAFNKINQGLNVPSSEIWQPSELPVPIENIRELIRWINQKPINNKFKTVILPLEDVSIPAANAFLKTLEEPPDYAIIFIAISNSQNILSTIKSRCQVVWLGEDKKAMNTLELGKLLERFMNVQDQLKEKSAGQILDEWIQTVEINSSQDVKLLHILLELKKLSLTNINGRLLVEYGVLLHQ